MGELQPGQTLGPYELVEELGRGGMATVFRARQPSLNRFVALKVLAPELARDPNFVSRFQREATIAARLEHPNIVPLHDIGQANGAFYIAMRFVPGRSLAQLIQQVGPLPLQRARHFLAQIASALDHAHQQGVVHRDLKPGNILWEHGDRVSLADFGIARAGDVTQVTRQGMLIGTPKYMAPEQALGQAVDHRADLYALGVITYELLTGTVPFEADSVATLLHRHAYEPPPPLREARSDLSPVVEAAVQRMLAKQPADRYPNGAAFVAALGPASSLRKDDSLPTMLATPPTQVAAAAPSRNERSVTLTLPPLRSLALYATLAILVVGVAAALALRPSLSLPAATPTTTAASQASPQPYPRAETSREPGVCWLAIRPRQTSTMVPSASRWTRRETYTSPKPTTTESRSCRRAAHRSVRPASAEQMPVSSSSLQVWQWTIRAMFT